MTECKLCQEGDQAITVRCWYCWKVFHLHVRQLNQAPADSSIMADCPCCGAVNCWELVSGEVRSSGPIVYDGEPIQDMRGKR